ncbi:DUF4382 domain-containing protein [Piscinibacter aquaticus]|uniref:DUF4382 domain-containing protein n=1 Tax=Piscinibacter aquaticus TaxID=392597 RepID=A0A5C6U1H7_9BURK|nr:DUF4382 domain-containing protein [Piscinibacter aquaticus]
MTLHTLLKPGILAAAATAALLAACGGGGSSSTAPGTLRPALTDAPACGFDEVNVTVQKVRVHQSSTAADGDSGWSEVVLNPARKLNLLDLTNGVLAELGQTELPAGTYSQLRLQLASNSGAAPLANSLVLTGGDGSEIPLDTPSAQQSGLKMNLNLTVRPNELADPVLDFDACKSVVVRGNSGRYNLAGGQRAAARAPRWPGGRRLRGPGHRPGHHQRVAAAERRAGALHGADGRWPLRALSGACRQLRPRRQRRGPRDRGDDRRADQRELAHLRDAGQHRDRPARRHPARRAATGTVSINGSTTVPVANVRATQAVSTTRVERIARPADADTGNYSLPLVTGSPVFTAYNAAATALTFAADASQAGKFRLEASTEGKAPINAEIDVTDADKATPLVFAP